MIKKIATKERRLDRKRRVRSKISGTATRPRLSIFRSLTSMSVQAIDDREGKTLAAVTLKTLGEKEKNTVESATAIGKLMGEKCLKLGIKEAIYDRSGYKYHGKVKAVAEGARRAGLKI